MAYFRICEYCGCSLDPGERCDCMNEPQSETLHVIQDARHTPPIRYRPRKEVRKNEQQIIKFSGG